MKIGLLTTGFPRFDGDHSGNFLWTLARGLTAQGHEVRVLAPEPSGGGPAPRWPRIDVRWVPYARPRTLQRTFYGDGAPDNLRRHPIRWVGAATFTASLFAAARRELTGCDALVSSWCIPNGLVAATLAGGRDHLCICHATDVRWLSNAPGGAVLARRIAAGATSMWFLSASLRDQFWQTAGLRCDRVPSHVGPMPVESPQAVGESRTALRRRLGIHGFTLLFLGRLVPVKGVDELLVAAAHARYPLSIRVAGDGPERERLTRLARDLGVPVTFEGWVRGPRKEALLRACDALVVPSRSDEGLPTVLFEARARGLPVIAFRVGAIADAIPPSEAARLVRAGDRVALGRAIDALAARHAAVRA